MGSTRTRTTTTKAAFSKLRATKHITVVWPKVTKYVKAKMSTKIVGKINHLHAAPNWNIVKDALICNKPKMTISGGMSKSIYLKVS